jgi:2-amino-4-hydroxy-6-hydroxymethyldihydropteridine diphosphokinase
MTSAVVEVYVAVGSNVRPYEHIGRALDMMQRRFGALTASKAYRNTAVGFEGEDFVNLVVGLRTSLSVTEVSGALRAIEVACGRPGDAPKWAPRTMDLDILLYGDTVLDEPGLKLPRPDLLRRSYMLGPLAEIAAGVRHPVAARTIGELWQSFDRTAHPLTEVSLPG